MMEYTHYPSAPRFEVEGSKKKPKVYLHCSYCNKRLRKMKKKEQIRVDRGYYCDVCDPGVEVANKPK